jgi:hypothetical protein
MRITLSQGVMMKRFACLLVAVVGVIVAAESAQADGWGSLHYGGYQPWWNIFAKRNPYMSVEEERLQRFWHDYYDSMRRYYGMLDRIDWVAYYKNHGYQINTGGCGPGGGSGRVQFAPVFVSPQMNWAVPNSQLSGAPAGPGYPPPQAFPNYMGQQQMGGMMPPGGCMMPMGGMMPPGGGMQPMGGMMPPGGVQQMGYHQQPMQNSYYQQPMQQQYGYNQQQQPSGYPYWVQ